MAGLMSADEIFDKAHNAAAAATGLDEKPMQIDYPELKQKIRAALGRSEEHTSEFQSR